MDKNLGKGETEILDIYILWFYDKEEKIICYMVEYEKNIADSLLDLISHKICTDGFGCSMREKTIF